MELLYVGCTHFYRNEGKWYSFPSSGDEFFQNFLGVFDSIKVLGTGMPDYINRDALVEIKDQRIVPIIVKNTNNPFDIKNRKSMIDGLEKEIKQAKAILIKPANYRGIQAIKLAKKYRKPYMIYLTGDIYTQLKRSNSAFKRLYAPYIYNATKKAISDCEYGLYISEEFLQRMYPISGKQYCCPDVVIPDVEESVITKRINRIRQRKSEDNIEIALIGFYQGNAKGIDTAIEALAKIDNRYHLNILGFGTHENQIKWNKYGESLGVFERIHFPEPKNGSAEVMKWLDSQDVFVLPSRSEGFGRVIIEAMARGLPCICTNVCTIPELVSEDWLIEIGDSNKLASLLKTIIGNEIVETELAKNNFEFSKKFRYDILKQRRDKMLTDFKEYASSFTNSQEITE